MNTLGKNIRSLRHQFGWSQAEVAKRLEISTPAFSMIETGISDINISRLVEFATMFQVHVLEIIPAECVSTENFFKTELDKRNIELAEARCEVINLQVKLIRLFEENRDLTRKLKITMLDHYGAAKEYR
jgi:transcriptional regulator with XRE-family HTH domain